MMPRPSAAAALAGVTAGAEDHRAGVMAQVVHHGRAGPREAAQRREGLRERTHTRSTVALTFRASEAPAPRWPSTPEIRGASSTKSRAWNFFARRTISGGAMSPSML